jgi:16S rRNA processing protein RimM
MAQYTAPNALFPQQSKTIVAKIKDIDNREQARAMIGIDVYIEKSQLPKLKKGEHYWEDLIGLEVVNRSNFDNDAKAS